MMPFPLRDFVLIKKNSPTVNSLSKTPEMDTLKGPNGTVLATAPLGFLTVAQDILYFKINYS
jgi:hypothetical protein